MTNTVPNQVNETRPQSTSVRFRRIRKCAVLLTLLATCLYWQRNVLLGRPLRAVVDHQIAARDLESAEQWVQTAQRLLPKNPEFAMLRASVARRSGDMQTVSDALKRAAQLGAPKSDLNREQWLALAQSGQMKQAEPHLAKLLTDLNQDNKEVCEAFVIGYIRTHRTDSALKLLGPWIADSADDATPLLQRARTYQLLSSPKEAESDFRAALEIEPEWNTAQLEYAEFLVRQNRFSDAVEYFQYLLTTESEDDRELPVRIRIGLAECRIAEGSMPEAAALLKTACRMDTTSLDAHLALGRTLVESGKYNDGIKPLLHALDLRPGYDETHFLLAQAYSLNGQRDRAAEHLRIVSVAREALNELDKLNADVLEDPGNAAKLIRGGEIMLMYGDPEEGVLRILTGLEHAPNNTTGLRLLAEHYRKKNLQNESYSKLATEFQQQLKEAVKTGSSQASP
ncbi:MAG: tetratricopeptide repeat protein [Fuerstiella sp.]|nr:tetratricopeptide repeat protein [Fuerstiella sp.]MCP4854635.1 tetratricopeptide repeat protein [Fuerstiella sp.]